MTNQNCCKQSCKINAIVTLDNKGQIVLPKDLREKANLNANDKLALIGFERDNQICCIVMLKADALEDTIKTMLEPVFQTVLQPEKEKP